MIEEIRKNISLKATPTEGSHIVNKDYADTKIAKSSIAKTFDSTCTNEQVTGAKDFYDNCIKAHPIYEYAISNGDLTKLGFSNLSEVTSLLVLSKAMKTFSKLSLQINQADRQQLYDNKIIPVLSSGILVIEKLNSRAKADFITDNYVSYITSTSNGGATEFGDWREITNTAHEVRTISSSFDFNNYTTQGIYFFSGDYGTLTNAPSLMNGWLHVMPGDGFVKQIVYRAGTPGTNSYQQYERESNDRGATWSDWIQITNKNNIVTYTSLAQIGLATDKTATLTEIWNKLDSNYCMLTVDSTQVADSELPVVLYGLIYIIKWSKHRGLIQFIEKETSNIYTKGILTDGSGLQTTWKQICTSTTYSSALVKFDLTTDQSNYVSGGDCWYRIKNGFCTVHFNVNCTTGASTDTTVFEGLPLPVATYRFALVNDYNGVTSAILGYVTTSGAIKLKGGTDSRNYYINPITYPIKE